MIYHSRQIWGAQDINLMPLVLIEPDAEFCKQDRQKTRRCRTTARFHDVAVVALSVSRSCFYWWKRVHASTSERKFSHVTQESTLHHPMVSGSRASLTLRITGGRTNRAVAFRRSPPHRFLNSREGSDSQPRTISTWPTAEVRPVR